jgi:uncharacterized protein (TIRG00374 family)
MSKKQNVRHGIWLALIFSITSIFFIFRNLTGGSITIRPAGINWYYLLGGLLILITVWFAKAFRMYVISSGMGIPKGSLFRYFQIYMATCFISHVTPFNSGGTPLQIYLLVKQGITLGKASAITVVDLGLNTLMFALLTLIAVVWNTKMLKSSVLAGINYHNFEWALWLLVVGFAGYLLYKLLQNSCALQKNWPGKLRAFLDRKGWLQRLRREFNLFKEGWSQLVKGNPFSILWAIVATIIYWLFYLLLAPIVIWALGQKVSFLGIMGRQLVINFAQIVIPTPGGSGGSELLLSYFFQGVVGGELVGIFILLWKIYTFFSTLLIGSVYFIKLTSGKAS